MRECLGWQWKWDALRERAAESLVNFISLFFGGAYIISIYVLLPLAVLCLLPSLIR
jgi:hypothetical protein